MRKALVAGALALAALLTNTAGATAVTPTAVTATAEAVPYTAWAWNVSGHKMNRGRTDNGLVEEAVGSIRRAENAVDFVSFNEICHSQYRAIRAQLASWNPDNPSYARFQESIPAGSTNGDGEICGGESFGKALFSRHQLGVAEYRTFAQESGLFYRSADGVEHPVTNGLLCAPLTERPNMRFCSVHIGPISTTEKPYGYRQLVELDTVLDGFTAAGQTYMIAGDFNAQPDYDRLNRFYSTEVPEPSGTRAKAPNAGDHRELDDMDASCPGHGEETSLNPVAELPCGMERPKIDMIFVRADRLASSDYSADSKAVPNCVKVKEDGALDPLATAPCSDHRVLIGKATLLVAPPAAS
ncbi:MULTISPECIES: endonuclease/exonuclease/phosphatase family protein [unclassified Streptomyces]|uniref:endonuclease/exonuclease/phosphatase family protein n=1 Tax=unclassified Streptomyces TaxID=2593676 RepID=UPI0036FEA169